MTNRIQNALKDLSAFSRGEFPVLSLYLDLGVDSTGQRQALTNLDAELDQAAADLPKHGPARESYEADRARLNEFLATELPKEANGLIIFASNGQGLWATIPLIVPVETQVAVDYVPYIFQLAKLLDDHESFVVAVAEGQQAQVYVFTLESADQVDSTAAREEIQRVEAGGWSQMRYQRRTGFVIQLHMNDLAKAIQDAVERYSADHIVIMTNDSVKGHVRAALPPQLSERVVDMVNYERNHDPEQLFALLEPLMQEAERQQEQELLSRLEDQLATKGGLAFAGDLNVTMALHKGQVDTLILSPAYTSDGGSECAVCGAVWPGRLESCPYDGGEILPVNLREALVLATLRQGGKVEVVSIDGALEQHGGVAALLRFRDDIGQEVGGAEISAEDSVQPQ